MALLSLGLFAFSGFASAQNAAPNSGRTESASLPAAAPSVPQAPQPSENATLPVGLSRSWDDPEPRLNASANPDPSLQTLALAAPSGKRTWYGGQILISDAVSASLAGLGFALSTKNQLNGVVGIGLASYVLTPPIIHITQGRWGMAAASANLRFFVPIVGMLVAGAIHPSPVSQDDDGVVPLGDTNTSVLGYMAGAALVTALDVSVFAWKRPTQDAQESPESATLGFVPVVSSDGKRGELLVLGTF
ncbi:MAG TPA: hypothetical protein VK745_24245 [Polyangiaceae bacterium]|nr:hypothetical protein [Polyangiaceae bacterium]